KFLFTDRQLPAGKRLSSKAAGCQLKVVRKCAHAFPGLSGQVEVEYTKTAPQVEQLLIGLLIPSDAHEPVARRNGALTPEWPPIKWRLFDLSMRNRRPGQPDQINEHRRNDGAFIHR